MKDETVRVGPLTNLPSLIRELGHEPDPIFESTGFKTAHFLSPDTELSYLAASKMLARCVAVTGCEHLGLLLGEKVDPSLLGIPGFMLRTAPDVGAALRALVRHLELHDRGASASLITHDRLTSLSYEIRISGVEAVMVIYDLSLVIICKIMQNICGNNWKPVEVLMSRPPPQNINHYRRAFDAPVRFDSDRNCVTFLSRWLDQPIATADLLLHRHLEKEANELRIRMETDILGKVRHYLRETLATRKCSAPEIAGQLGLHERSLNRQLGERGTTFQKELNEIRYDIARQLLSGGTISLSKIATRLGYSDPAAFSRAFKKWSGMTPTAWRSRETKS